MKGFAYVAVLLALPLHAAERENVTVRVTRVAGSARNLYLGEPLELEVSTVNQGDVRLTGAFRAHAYSSTAAYYVEARGPARRLDEPRMDAGAQAPICAIRSMDVLEPEQAVKTQLQFVVEAKTGTPWLSQEGEYGVFVVVRPFLGDPSREIRSETLRVTVSEPPDRYRDAYEAYLSEGLIHLVADPAQRLQEDPHSAEAAESFVKRFGDTPYGRHVRNALLRGLVLRLSTGRADNLEERVYERIRVEEDEEIEFSWPSPR